MAKGPKPAPCWLPGLLPWAHSGLTKNQVTSLGQHLEKRWKSPCSLVAPNSEKNSPGNLHAHASGSYRRDRIGLDGRNGGGKSRPLPGPPPRRKIGPMAQAG